MNTSNINQKVKLPPFDLLDKCHYWASHTVSDEITIAVKLTGTIDPAVFEDAIRDVIKTTPILRTTITERGIFIHRKKHSLKSSFSVKSIITISNVSRINEQEVNTGKNEQIISFINTPLDFKQEFPLKLFMLMSKTETYIFLKMHHTATDAFGVYLTLSKIIQTYNSKLGENNTVRLPAEPRTYSLKKIYKLLKKENKLEKKPPQMHNISFFRDSDETSGLFKNHIILIPKSQFQELKNFSKKNDLTINDIMLGSVMLSSYKILQKRGQEINTIRIAQTANIRSFLDIDGGIKNLSSTFHATAEKEDFKSIATLLQAIRNERERSKEERESLINLIPSKQAKRTPSKKMTAIIKEFDKQYKGQAPFVTGMITNVGRIDHILEPPAHCTIDYTWLITPQHYSYGMQWFIATAHNRIAINISHLDTVIKDETIRQIKHFFEESLKAILSS